MYSWLHQIQGIGAMADLSVKEDHLLEVGLVASFFILLPLIDHQ